MTDIYLLPWSLGFGIFCISAMRISCAMLIGCTTAGTRVADIYPRLDLNYAALHPCRSILSG